jgi:hypothetical protein
VSFTSSFAFGGSPAGSQRFASTRGRASGGSSAQGVNYPSPFFDIAHTYLPTTVKQLFRFCRYYFLTNPLINATVFKLSEYPITDLIVDHEDPQVKKRWTDYLHDHLQIRNFQVETGLDYFCYGNGVVGLSFPFQKYLTCRSCNWTERADKTKKYWTFTNYDFRLSCPRCQTVSEAIAHDKYYKNASGIKPIRWNVEDLEIDYNDITGESTYFYTIPGPLRNDIVIGKKDTVSTIPQIFIQALRQRKGVIFNPQMLFHLKRPTLAWQDRGWGTPLILPVLKDTFYLQLMKKAQEAILIEHIVPLRILFPQAASGTSDPFTTINLVDWKDQVASEIARWRFDNNYIPIMPLPLGQQSVGGDGKALLLFNEMQAQSEHIIMGLGVPREFLQGGLSFAGTNVSMRMLENAFISYIGRQRLMIKWMMKTIAHYMEWPEVNVRFKPFKMADDLQRKAYLFQLNQAQKVSDTTLLSDADLEQSEEDEIMVRETDKRLEATKKQQLAMAEIQGESQMIMMKMQAKAEQAQMEAQQGAVAPGEPGGPQGMQSPGMAEMQAQQGGGGQMAASAPQGAQSPVGADQRLQPGAQGQPGTQGGGDIQQMAQMYAQQIMAMAPNEQQMAIQALMQQSPELGQLVQQFMSTMGGSPGQTPSGPQVDMRPQPEQLPARRDTAIV